MSANPPQSPLSGPGPADRFVRLIGQTLAQLSVAFITSLVGSTAVLALWASGKSLFLFYSLDLYSNTRYASIVFATLVTVIIFWITLLRWAKGFLGLIATLVLALICTTFVLYQFQLVTLSLEGSFVLFWLAVWQTVGLLILGLTNVALAVLRLRRAVDSSPEQRSL